MLRSCSIILEVCTMLDQYFDLRMLLVSQRLSFLVIPQPPRNEITKIAIGAEAFVHWRYVENPIREMESLKKEGYTLYGLEQTDSSISLLDHRLTATDKVCIVMGNEVNRH